MEIPPLRVSTVNPRDGLSRLSRFFFTGSVVKGFPDITLGVYGSPSSFVRDLERVVDVYDNLSTFLKVDRNISRPANLGFVITIRFF